MSVLTIVCAVVSLAVLPIFQEPHGAAEHRARHVMGFDQQRTVHHFLLFDDGGAIDVSVKDTSDTRNREAIRSHLRHLAVMFGGGTFDAPMLVHDSANVPGSTIMAARKDLIRYQYVETRGGGRVTILTSDRDALGAVHAFLKYQIAEHKTGDPTAPRPR